MVTMSQDFIRDWAEENLAGVDKTAVYLSLNLLGKDLAHIESIIEDYYRTVESTEQWIQKARQPSKIKWLHEVGRHVDNRIIEEFRVGRSV